MGDIENGESPAGGAIERALPWGPTIRGESWGSGAGQILFLHEPGADFDAWQGLPRALTHSLPIEIVAFDLPGHGLSDDPWAPERLPDLLRLLAEPQSPERPLLLVTAGGIAAPALELAASLPLAGLMALSPVHTGTLPPRSPRVPKFFAAGAGAAEDVDNARALATAAGGWAIVTSLPVPETGTGLLRSAWAGRLREEIGGFLRDCLRFQHPRKTGPQSPEQATIEGRDAQQRARTPSGA